MKKLFLFVLVLLTLATYGQKPKNGTYTYSIAFAEWDGKSLGASCTVVIKGDSIKVIHNGTGNLTAKKGEILDKGIIMTHKKTGKYIIGHKPSDVNVPEVSGCEGPSIIDFLKKLFWMC